MLGIATIALCVMGLTATALPSQVAGEDVCLSCDWISPEGTVALFKMNNQMEESKRAGHMVTLNNPLADDMLMSIMTDVVDIMDTKQCNETLAGKLVTMLARLEEGPNPTQKNMVPYVKRPLVDTLEQHFVRYLNLCMSEALGMAKLARNNPNVQYAWTVFVKFGEFLIKKTQEVQAAGRSAGSAWFTGGFAMFDPDNAPLEDLGPGSTPDPDPTMKRAKKIMSWEYLYEKVRTIWGKYFGADTSAGPMCQQALNENLYAKFQSLSQDLAGTIKPLLILSGYSPDNFVKVPKEAKADRPIYELLEHVKTTMKDDNALANLVSLHLLMRKTFQRAENYCPRSERMF